MTLSAVADLTMTVRFGGAVIDTVVVQVVVRALTATPLTAASVADQTGATGDVVDLTIGVATGGRSPYSYAYADLPEELGANRETHPWAAHHPWHVHGDGDGDGRQWRHRDRDVRLGR